MKTCPRCHIELHDRDEARVNGWKVAFFTLLAVVIMGGAVAAYFSLTTETDPQQDQPAPTPVEHRPQGPPARAEDSETLASVAELPPEELLEILPKNLLRRFHAGEPSQGKPDDHRVIKDEKGEFIVLIGRSRIEGGPRVPAARILILQYGDNQFRDVTRQALPAPYSRGLITGPRAEVKFESESLAIILTEPASSNALVNECPSCERAYQQVRLEWKSPRYVEAGRTWENHRYSAFYAVADALDKRRVDDGARALIDPSLDARIAEGFDRRSKEGWSVRLLTDTASEDTCSYQVSNGEQLLTVTLTRIDGQWKATRISDE